MVDGRTASKMAMEGWSGRPRMRNTLDNGRMVNRTGKVCMYGELKP
jgi:hypothetical protein